MLRWLQVIINCVWISEKIPDDWRRCIILPFWKRKGDRLTCVNHRGITLLSIPGKLLALILLRRSVSAIRSTAAGPSLGIDLDNWRLTDMDYADDIALFSPTSEDLSSVLRILSKEAAKFGMSISWTKTKVRMISPSSLQLQLQ